MIDKDTRSLHLIKAWETEEHENDSHKKTRLQCFINAALEEQDLLTKNACAEAILSLLSSREFQHPSIFNSEFAEACKNVKAL